MNDAERTTIFVTVGAQMAFDRLVGAVDEWAGGSKGADVFAQIGPSALRPRHMQWTKFLEPEEFRSRVIACRAIVSHAGMGTILTALEHRRPIVVMPRRGDLGETRNDHQVATAERFRRLGHVHVAADEREIAGRLDGIAELSAAPPVPPHASPELLRTLREFVAEVGARRAAEARS